ncbi:acyltransferase family protein [Brenneria tiliae]|uniref:acyltransferase family protein n=1 Tax=Brenneria tiliae TaxID=2914984 RepID=UPI002014A95E|nr:acyltransferase [Brenneria tiliae]MCL2900279.1 acyltransferase [Brenneria tiliae]MCL2904234.1 acyltransferase [Brenneria tiliae]
MQALLFLAVCTLPIFSCFLFYPLLKNKFAEEISDGGKISTIDGLRGLAATTVIIHHGILMSNLFTDSTWKINAGYISYFNETIHRTLTQFGSFGVMVFFMITGYLFWNKALKGGTGDVGVFYKRRIYRLLPLYLFAVICVYFLSFLIGFSSNMDMRYFVNSLASWLSFGFVQGMPLTDSKPGWLILCGVFWTLAIEVKFYALFPFLASLCKNRVVSLLMLLGAVAVLLVLLGFDVITGGTYSILFAFICGMLTATLQQFPSFQRETRNINARPWLKRLFAALAIGSVALSFSLFEFAYTSLSVLLIALFFLIAASGNSLFGLLTLKPVRFSGIISYSTYIIHGLVLTSAFTLIYPDFGAFAALAVAFALVTLISVFTYLKIEKPFIIISHGKKTRREPQALARAVAQSSSCAK